MYEYKDNLLVIMSTERYSYLLNIINFPLPPKALTNLMKRIMRAVLCLLARLVVWLLLGSVPQASLALSTSHHHGQNGNHVPTTTTASTTTTTSSSGSKDLIYDMPVSNNGARCRIIAYKKGLVRANLVEFVSPMQLGGLGSPEYKRVHVQSKMPAIVCSNNGSNNNGNNNNASSFGESDTIARYLIHKYARHGPSFQIDDPASNYLARLHDAYLTPIQGCIYKAAGPFGSFWTRKDALAEYVRQWKIIDDLIVSSYITDASPYLCGTQVSLADATLFPSAVFAAYMLPKFWKNDDHDHDVGSVLPPKIDSWFRRLRSQDAAFATVYDEMTTALRAWDERGRWDAILGAGRRDWEEEPPATMFDEMIAAAAGDVSSSRAAAAMIVPQADDKILAFRKDSNPATPAHVLVIPKDRNGLTRLTKSSAEHVEILGRLLVAAGEIARNTELGFGDGARIVINDGPDGGQEIPHLHVSRSRSLYV